MKESFGKLLEYTAANGWRVGNSPHRSGWNIDDLGGPRAVVAIKNDRYDSGRNGVNPSKDL